MVSPVVWTLLLCCSVVLGDTWSIDVSGCGVTKGCYRIPSDCTNASDCTYFLTWEHVNDNVIYFEYAAQYLSSHKLPWVAFGITDIPNMMIKATVVDCIVNGSNSDRVAIQLSYNDGNHNNNPLNNKYLGLVPDSLSGAVVDGHIFCNFARLRTVNKSDPESDKVRNLTSPCHVIFASGPADDAGNKQIHDFNSVDPYPVSETIDFDNYTNNNASSPSKNAFVRTHVTLMVVAWMVLASLAMFTSRYMKNQWKENGMICRKPAWFQLHRLSMAFVLGLTVCGMILIFAHKNWTFIIPRPQDVSSLHPSFGIAIGVLLVLNLLGGLLRPDIHSPYRIYFQWCHMILGHGSHLLAAVTMYLGVMQREAYMPDWSRWVVVLFACWRILSDVILTFTRIRFNDPTANYVAIANNETDENTNWISAWRCGVMIVYMIGVVILALTLIIAANI